jgi:hypothetical protein
MTWVPQAVLDVLREQLAAQSAEIAALRGMVDRLTTPPAPPEPVRPVVTVVPHGPRAMPEAVRAVIARLAEGDAALAAQMATWARDQLDNGADAQTVAAMLEDGG